MTETNESKADLKLKAQTDLKLKAQTNLKITNVQWGAMIAYLSKDQNKLNNFLSSPPEDQLNWIEVHCDYF